MSSLPVFVGLDYHQDSVQVCVLDEAGAVLCNRSVENDDGVIARLSRRHGQPKRIAIEACCGAADLAEQLVTKQDLPIQMAHPGYVSRMKSSPDKTDFGDARILADLARVNYIPEVWMAPRETRELRRYMRYRAQLVRRRRDIKLRIRALLRENRLKCETANAWTQEWYDWLQNTAQLSEADRWILDEYLSELDSLDRRLAAAQARIELRVKDDPIVQKLMSLPGVGWVTAATIRAEVGRFDRFNNGKQLARFCGVTPRNSSSGHRQADAGLIRAGNRDLRTVLIELAHRLCSRIDSPWKTRAASMLKRGKPKNVVVAAVANRWVRRLLFEINQPPSELGSGSTKGAAPSAPALASP